MKRKVPSEGERRYCCWSKVTTEAAFQVEALVSNRGRELSSLKQGVGGKDGASRWWGGVRPTSGRLTLLYNYVGNTPAGGRRDGEGRPRSHGVLQKLLLYPFWGSCAAFGERFTDCPAFGQSRRVMESREFLWTSCPSTCLSHPWQCWHAMCKLGEKIRDIYLWSGLKGAQLRTGNQTLGLLWVLLGMKKFRLTLLIAGLINHEEDNFDDSFHICLCEKGVFFHLVRVL